MGSCIEAVVEIGGGADLLCSGGGERMPTVVALRLRMLELEANDDDDDEDDDDNAFGDI